MLEGLLLQADCVFTEPFQFFIDYVIGFLKERILLLGLVELGSLARLHAGACPQIIMHLVHLLHLAMQFILKTMLVLAEFISALVDLRLALLSHVIEK